MLLAANIAVRFCYARFRRFSFALFFGRCGANSNPCSIWRVLLRIIEGFCDRSLVSALLGYFLVFFIAICGLIYELVRILRRMSSAVSMAFSLSIRLLRRKPAMLTTTRVIPRTCIAVPRARLRTLGNSTCISLYDDYACLRG